MQTDRAFQELSILIRCLQKKCLEIVMVVRRILAAVSLLKAMNITNRATNTNESLQLLVKHVANRSDGTESIVIERKVATLNSHSWPW